MFACKSKRRVATFIRANNLKLYLYYTSTLSRPTSNILFFFIFFFTPTLLYLRYNRLFARGKITEGLMESRKGCCSEFSAGLLEKGKLFRSFLLIPDPTFARLSYRLFEGWPPSSPTCFFWYVKRNGFSLSFVVKRFISCNFAISIYSYIRNGGFRRFEIILINQWYPMMMTLNT